MGRCELGVFSKFAWVFANLMRTWVFSSSHGFLRMLPELGVLVKFKPLGAKGHAAVGTAATAAGVAPAVEPPLPVALHAQVALEVRGLDEEPAPERPGVATSARVLAAHALRVGPASAAFRFHPRAADAGWGASASRSGAFHFRHTS